MSKKNRPAAQPIPAKPALTLLNAEVNEVCGRKWRNLFAPVDISSIVLFRIFFGLVLFIEMCRYFSKGWITEYWIETKYHFTYWPFNFLSPLPGSGMYVLFFIMAVLSICIMLGLFYRFSIITFALCFTYTFLLEQTRYLNHFYLVILLSMVMIFIPANRSGALDVRIFKKRSETAPAWSLWLLRFMIGLPYFFGGVAKLNSDWLQGEPLRMWLAEDTGFPIIGRFFTENWMIMIMAYSGLLLDLATFPLLIFKRTRVVGIILITTFHLMNSEMFDIGIFPWFMIGACTLFFKPDWARNFVRTFSVKPNRWAMTTPPNFETSAPSQLSSKQKLTAFILVAWVLLHIALPLRHLLFPGNVNWTEEGHKYSWHMKLRSKRSVGDFIVKDKKTGEQHIVNEKDYLISWQRRKMRTDPKLIWQFCQFVKEDYKERGIDVAVYANLKATLNGRVHQQFIDSSIDLTSVPRPLFTHSSWVLPLITPLNDRLKSDTLDQASQSIE